MSDEIKIKKALSALQKFCAYRERAENEVRTRLKKFGLSVNDEKRIVNFLVEQGFLNEKRFALSYTLGKFNLSKWGKIKIKHGLRVRGIDENIISEVVNSITEEDYDGMIKKLAGKRSAGMYSPRNLSDRKKIFTYLIQKGFEYERIVKVIGSPFD